MSAVSRNVMRASSAASITARVPARSRRRPKLLQPSPTTETARSERPSWFCRIAAQDGTLAYSDGDGLCPRAPPPPPPSQPPPLDVLLLGLRAGQRALAAAGQAPPPQAAAARPGRARRGAARTGRRSDRVHALARRRRGPVARGRPAVRGRLGERRPAGGVAPYDRQDARGAAAGRLPRELSPGGACRDSAVGARRPSRQAARRAGSRAGRRAHAAVRPAARDDRAPRGARGR